MGLARLIKAGLPMGLRRRLKHARADLRNRGMGPAERAVQWIRDNRIPGDGIAPFPGNPTATQEVTGYTIPTLYQLGEKELACDLARWEASVQRPDGAVVALDGIPYTFDTAQAVRGFLAVLDDLPELEGNLRRACDYVASQIDAAGRVLHESYDTWMLEGGLMLSEYGNLYCLPPLLQAGQRLNERRYVTDAQRSMDYYRSKDDLMLFRPDMSMITHYLGYMTEACVDMGAVDLAEQGLKQAQALQRDDGSIPAFPGVNWVCSTGQAQLAIAWYKLGQPEPADRALAYMETLQNPTGGFYGSYGRGARYFPRQEIAWAAKFYLDACQWRIRTTFDREMTAYWDTISPKDGRIHAVQEALGDLAGRDVLDVGCGRGRYLRELKSTYPSARLCGVDPSQKALSHCPKGIQTRVGSMLNLPYPNHSFDAVLCVEALEHAMLIDNAVREMTRVLRPGGRIVIVDKDASKSGALERMSWEKWFAPRQVQDMLARNGVRSTFKPIPYDGHRADGLFVACTGIKEQSAGTMPPARQQGAAHVDG